MEKSIVEEINKICDYGCGKEAKYQFKNGKWCCSKSHNSCLENKKKRSASLRGHFVSDKTKRKLSIFNKGKTLSIETRIKMSKSKKGKNHPFFGRKHSKESRKKMSESSIGQIAWNKGISPGEETIRKMSRSLKGRKVWNKGKMGIYSKETIRKMSMSKKLTIEEILERYPFFSKIEKMRYKPGRKEIQVHCKNHECKNSKEKGGWFTPTRTQLYERIRQLENKNGNDGSHFYCSDNCKNGCPLYNLQSDPYKDIEKLYTDEEYQTFRKFVLERDGYECQYCGGKATDVHHERPQKLEPFFSLDPDFALSCCEECHYEKGHKDECSTGNLAKKIC